MDWLENITSPLDGDLLMDGAIDGRDCGSLILSILSHPKSVHLPQEALDHCKRLLVVDEPSGLDWRKLTLIADFVRGESHV